MRSLFCLTSAAVLAITLTGCGSSDDADNADEAGQSATPTPSASPSDSPSEAASQTPSPSASATPSAGDATSVTVTVGGTERTLRFATVRCEARGAQGSQPGFVIAKANGGRTLLKAEGQRFVLVKDGPGQPWRANQPTGVTFSADSVAFDDVRLSGGAVLDGTLACPPRTN